MKLLRSLYARTLLPHEYAALAGNHGSTMPAGFFLNESVVTMIGIWKAGSTLSGMPVGCGE